MVENHHASGLNVAESDIVAYYRHICLGLSLLHNAKVAHAHFDLKPANVMLTDSNEAVLIDLASVAPARQHLKTSQQVMQWSGQVQRYTTGE